MKMALWYTYTVHERGHGSKGAKFSRGRDLSMAGLGVVGVTGLESDLVCREPKVTPIKDSSN